MCPALMYVHKNLLGVGLFVFHLLLKLVSYFLALMHEPVKESLVRKFPSCEFFLAPAHLTTSLASHITHITHITHPSHFSHLTSHIDHITHISHHSLDTSHLTTSPTSHITHTAHISHHSHLTSNIDHIIHITHV